MDVKEMVQIITSLGENGFWVFVIYQGVQFIKFLVFMVLIAIGARAVFREIKKHPGFWED